MAPWSWAGGTARSPGLFSSLRDLRSSMFDKVMENSGILQDSLAPREIRRPWALPPHTMGPQKRKG